jgi:alkyl hydroperoxide reductase subunit AhpC
MSIQLGQIAPDFTQESSQGPIHFHEWLGHSWGILFSHPKDFTPVCTTELGEVARLRPEWEKRDKMMPKIIDYVKENPRWRICIQTHKVINVP